MKLSIKELRRAKNISQSEMASLCAVNINTYRTWEDNPADIKLSKAVIIADRLGIELKDILFLPSDTTNTSIYHKEAI